MRYVRRLLVALPVVAMAGLLSACIAKGGQGVTVPAGADLLRWPAAEVHG